MQPEIFPGTSFEEIVAQIASLSEPEFNALRDDVAGEAAFDVSKKRCDRLAKVLRSSPETVALLISVISILFDRVSALPPGASAREAIEQFVNGFDDEAGLGVNEKTMLASRLFELTASKPAIEAWTKIRQLKVGFLDNAKRFATFVDLRPNFTPKYEGIRGYVPMIQFRITTDSDDPSREELVFQVDEEALADLKSAIESVELKLSALQKPDALTAPVMFKKRDM